MPFRPSPAVSANSAESKPNDLFARLFLTERPGANLNEMRYEFSEHYERGGWYVVTDTKWMMVCEFEAHRFNETQNYIDLGMLPADPDKVAHAMSELGDWLFSHHYSEIFPAPTFELRRSEDEKSLHIIGHKVPHVCATFQADELDSLDDAAERLEKMAQFLRKRMKAHFKK